MPTAVAVLPGPLTTSALFGYGILRFLGQISKETHVRFTPVSGSPGKLFTCQDRVVDLRLKSSELYTEVIGLIGTDSTLKRILTFAFFGGRDAHDQLERLGAVLQKMDTENSRRALSLIFELIAKSVEMKSDVWKSTKDFNTFVLLSSGIQR